MHKRTHILSLAVAACVATGADAQPVQPSAEDAMPMADYLALLEQIAPAARSGAEAYLRAHQQRCGRRLTTADLRRAMSQAGGDPALLGMIRATQLRDSQALSSLTQALRCGGRK